MNLRFVFTCLGLPALLLGLTGLKPVESKALSGLSSLAVPAALLFPAVGDVKSVVAQRTCGCEAVCIPVASLCNGCIDNFNDLNTRVANGGQIYICDGTTITVNQTLTVTTNTTISCCNNCAVGRESTCVLEKGVDDIIMFERNFGGQTRVRFELQGIVVDGSGDSLSEGYAVELNNVDFFLTSSAVINFQSLAGGAIEVFAGSMTSTDVQDNLASAGVVYLDNSNGFFQTTDFSNNEATGSETVGGAITVNGMATVEFVGSTFDMNTAPNSNRTDIGVRTTTVATVTCDDETICNSNGNDNKVFIEGNPGFINECPLTPVDCPA